MSKLTPSSSLGSSPTSKAPRVGVLGLQGDFAEHLGALREIGAEAIDVRLPEQLDEVDALIVPGGESTTIGKLAERYGIIPKLKERVAGGMPVWGTCAGAIFLAKDVPGHPHPLAGLMDISVERNAFGRQVDSFEADLDVKGMPGKPYHAVFIRAPKITHLGRDVEALATLADGTVVAAREGNLLATSFHPELTHDDRFHRLFLSLGKR
ncbi:MAG TPA: pyridoxal 5'-phosphate synthase glutaminase subunit PdxT [Candidatus Limnocylindria bacterium]|nr:pyridoxal 5'-phosphate synthase glutaminase subunit PdxT [Candidatus Limnocylindria bacterium]